MGFKEFINTSVGNLLTQSKEDKLLDNRTALVDGVYMRNHPIRKEMMRWVWAKYNMLPDVITDSLGKLYDMSKDLYMPEKNWKSLYNFTHDKSSVYSRNIAKKYLNAFEGNTTAEIRSVPKGNYVRFPYDTKEFIQGVKKANNGISYYYVDLDSETILNSRGMFYDDTGALEYGISNNTISTEVKPSRSRLLNTTAKLIREGRVKSLVSRFTSGKSNEGSEYIDSVNRKYGISRGKSLPKVISEKTNGYDDPYCRTWTWHKQYSKVSDLIRPFTDGNIENLNLIKQFRVKDGGDYLGKNSVLGKNGFVQITPSKDRKTIKNCMFSIENLAWKDVNSLDIENLTAEQRGPNGGRIMWFPPYDLSFQENVNVNWNETNFIGRGEPIYTYSNTKRSGTLNFTLLIDHPSIINGGLDIVTNNDEDLLRYFTGDNLLPLDISAQNMLTSVKNLQESSNSVSNNRETRTSDPNNGKKLTFFVYFPYGYSGNMRTGGDADWTEYLIQGWGVDFNFDEDGKEIGYEMINGRHLTDNAWDYEGIKIPKTGYYYHYRVDRGNEFDWSKVKGVDENDSNYLITNGTDLNSKKHSWNAENITETTTNFKDFYNRKYEGNDFGDAIKKKGITKVTLIGYDNTMKGNHTPSDMAYKRALSVKKWLMGIFNDDKITYEIIRRVVDVNSDDTNSTEAKESRCVYVEITYNAASVEGNSTSATTNQSASTTTNSNVIVAKEGGYYGYSYINEYEYFKDLNINDKFLFDKLTERFKYFSPAFHSITPEGFNSRLNFLHQCTRQGHTIEGKDSNNKVASNMAFGRPPFCVLRIGDFINTKIVVKGITITYENGGGMQWDLNPEGIGVQPMYAKINMQIDIIGGQSLEAPISRLNNAVSFNYYANTGVYDHRADEVIHNGNEIKYREIWNPTMNNDESNKK